MTAAVTLLSTKGAVVAGVLAALAPLGLTDNNVQTHHGRFTLATLQTFGARTPAARVTTNGVATDGARAAPISARVRFTVYLVTSDVTRADQPLLPRDQVMDNLVGALITALNENAFGVDTNLGLDQPENISAENVYSDEATGLAVLLWAVSWTQGVELDVLTPDEYAALPELTLITTDAMLASEADGEIEIQGEAHIGQDD